MLADVLVHLINGGSTVFNFRIYLKGTLLLKVSLSFGSLQVVRVADAVT